MGQQRLYQPPVLIAWGAMSVRTYWAEAQSQPALIFTLVGLAGSILLAVVGWILRKNDHDRPWMILGGVSMVIGVASLPLSPP